MCESTVYLIRNGEKELIMENVTFAAVDGADVVLSGLLGESKTVKGRITRIDSDRHEIIIE